MSIVSFSSRPLSLYPQVLHEHHSPRQIWKDLPRPESGLSASCSEEYDSECGFHEEWEGTLGVVNRHVYAGLIIYAVTYRAFRVSVKQICTDTRSHYQLVI